MKVNFIPEVRSENIVVQQTAEEILIYDLQTCKAFCLNETSSLVWRLSDGKRPISKIADEMSKRTKTNVNNELVVLALGQLNREGLLKGADRADGHFLGTTRREMIRKVGFGSIISLPMVSSIVAPRAAMAQSGGALGSPCTMTSQCVTPLNCVGGGGFPPACCVGTAESRPPGSILCADDQAACDANAAMNCCSGFGTIGSPGTCVPVGNNSKECICN